ncbi:hypothetical protein HF394_14865 [Planococcus glaciei]|uniref:Secreted protein n=1 Tax=Planococcus glaciei TaxID=459472 RepID=A0A7H8QD03_9BACL|nr:hypothetical protein [Planococcus glaciei]ETP68929.1 hypothetical protein G159_10235 [Planococcus glaciei CHR43]QDY46267.1 hypothetical protein FK545_15540 [Planococcus glaciei]QKX51749.1 hypothetical protein HF394_14865 [Planococcus glaciei]
MKKVVSILLVLVLSIVSVSQASAAGWNNVGQQTFTGITSIKTLKTKTFQSTGGDFQGVFHYQHQNLSVQLWEYDPDNADDLVRSWQTAYGQGGSLTYRDIGKYVDGSDGKAEFYFVIKTTDSTPSQRGLQVTAYD